MGGQRDPGLSCVLQVLRLKVSQAGNDQGGGAEAQESFWGKVGFFCLIPGGLHGKGTVDEDGKEFAWWSCGGRYSRQREQLKLNPEYGIDMQAKFRGLKRGSGKNSAYSGCPGSIHSPEGFHVC